MNKKEKYSVGVDLGGTFIKLGIVSESGKILSKNFIDSKAGDGPKAVIKQINKGFDQLLKYSKLKIEGIGIGAPGVVQTKKGTVEHPPNFPGWGKIHLGKILQKSYDYPIIVENDANAAAIGELIFGAGKKLKSFIMVTLGTGVGGGIIINKKLYRGESGAAGEIGHLSIDFDGKRCNCGSLGCIESYAGNKYLVEDVKNILRNHPDSQLHQLILQSENGLEPKIISIAAKNGDEFAITIIQDAGSKIGFALASLANVLDISAFIIGGGVSGFGKILLERIKLSAEARVLKSLKNRISILPAKLKNDAGVLGAASLVFYKM